MPQKPGAAAWRKRHHLGSLSEDNDYYRVPNAFLASAPGNDFWLRAAEDAFAPAWEQSVERLAGPFRLQWAQSAYQPANCAIHGGASIYPIDWIHLLHWDNDRYFRPDRARLFQQAVQLHPSEMAALFPDSYCVTFWRHNW